MISGVRVCCTSTSATLYYYADALCQQRLGGVLQPTPMDPNNVGPPRPGVQLPLSDCAQQTAGNLLPQLDWYSASCRATTGVPSVLQCPSLVDDTRPTVRCPTLETAVVDFRHIVALDTDDLEQSIRNGTAMILETSASRDLLKFATIGGHGVNNSWLSLGLIVRDDSDYIFVQNDSSYVGGEGIDTVTVLWQNGYRNETVTADTKFSVGEHVLFFIVSDRAQGVDGAELPNIASCSTILVVEDVCGATFSTQSSGGGPLYRPGREFDQPGLYCGEHGTPDSFMCWRCLCDSGWTGITCEVKEELLRQKAEQGTSNMLLWLMIFLIVVTGSAVTVHWSKPKWYQYCRDRLRAFVREKILGYEPEGEAERKARIARLYGDTQSFRVQSFKGAYGKRDDSFQSTREKRAADVKRDMDQKARRAAVNPKGEVIYNAKDKRKKKRNRTKLEVSKLAQRTGFDKKSCKDTLARGSRVQP